MLHVGPDRYTWDMPNNCVRFGVYERTSVVGSIYHNAHNNSASYGSCQSIRTSPGLTRLLKKLGIIDGPQLQLQLRKGDTSYNLAVDFHRDSLGTQSLYPSLFRVKRTTA